VHAGVKDQVVDIPFEDEPELGVIDVNVAALRVGRAVERATFSIDSRLVTRILEKT
jgi:hypothetical protein